MIKQRKPLQWLAHCNKQLRVQLPAQRGKKGNSNPLGSQVRCFYMTKLSDEEKDDISHIPVVRHCTCLCFEKVLN